MMKMPVVVVVLSAALGGWSFGQVHYVTGLQFPATAAQATFSLPLGRDIVIDIRRAVDAKGLHMGWDFSAIDRRIRDSPNFFYDCLCGHGPRLNDMYAWHVAEALFPGDRLLPVYGYPFEVRVRCIGCQVDGTSGADAHFTAGTIDVDWRRLKESNPRQMGISEFLRRGRN